MWRAVLGVETEIFLLDWEEYETRLRTGEYDLAKRSALMQTPDEETNLLAMFDPRRLSFEQSESDPAGDAGEAQQAEGLEDERRTNGAPESSAASLPAPVTSEAQALNEVPAIPLYFASSFSLVKPYVRGFDANMLDAPSLRRVRIDTGWRQPAQGQTANSGGD
jgi:hypothetical protein